MKHKLGTNTCKTRFARNKQPVSKQEVTIIIKFAHTQRRTQNCERESVSKLVLMNIHEEWSRSLNSLIAPLIVNLSATYTFNWVICCFLFNIKVTTEGQQLDHCCSQREWFNRHYRESNSRPSVYKSEVSYPTRRRSYTYQQFYFFQSAVSPQKYNYLLEFFVIF